MITSASAGLFRRVDESAKDCARVARKWCTLLKIRGSAPCGPLLSGDAISRVLMELELLQKTQQSSFKFNTHHTDKNPRVYENMARFSKMH